MRVAGTNRVHGEVFSTRFQQKPLRLSVIRSKPILSLPLKAFSPRKRARQPQFQPPGQHRFHRSPQLLSGHFGRCNLNNQILPSGCERSKQ